MPWLATQEDVREHIACLADVDGAIDIQRLMSNIDNALSDLLSRERIDVVLQISLILEEQARDSCRRVMTRDSDHVFVVGYEEYVRRRSTACAPSELLELRSSYAVVCHPDERSRTCSVPIQLATAAWITSVHIVCEGETIASLELQQTLPAGPSMLPVPAPAVRFYGRLASSSSTRLRLFIGDNPQPIEAILEIALPSFRDEPVTLFVDMGSTRFKMIAMEAGDWRDYSSAQVRLWVDALNQEEMTDDIESRIEAFSPRPTSDALRFYDIPLTDKQSLASLSDTELAAWISHAVARLALHWANKTQSRARGEVVWSFPQTEESPRDFVAVAEQAGPVVAKHILGELHIIAEHVALRARFEKAFGVLSALSHDTLRRKEEAEKTNEKRLAKKNAALRDYRKRKKQYDSSWFKAFRSEPDHPDWSRYAPDEVPSLREFHERFMKLSPTAGFADWLVLDAGGFTLDVFAMISGQKLGRSFVAGGDQLTEEVRSELAGIKGVDESSITMADAEKAKRDACHNRSAASMRPLAQFCERRTQVLYAPAVRSVVAWVRQVTAGHPICLPLVLTGGGMYNDFLRALVQTEFEASGITAITPLTSTEVCQILEKEFPTGVIDSGLYRFYRASQGFSRNLRADMSRDVASGLVEWLTTKLS